MLNLADLLWRTLWSYRGFDKDVLKHRGMAEVFVYSEANLSAAWLETDKGFFYLGIWVTVKKKRETKPKKASTMNNNNKNNHKEKSPRNQTTSPKTKPQTKLWISLAWNIIRLLNKHVCVLSSFIRAEYPCFQSKITPYWMAQPAQYSVFHIKCPCKRKQPDRSRMKHKPIT